MKNKFSFNINNKSKSNKICNFSLFFVTLSLIISTSFGNLFSINSFASSEDTPSSLLHIGICLDEKNEYSTLVVKGYKDALASHFGEKGVIYAQQSIEKSPSSATAAQSLILAGSDLIFTYGDASLSAAASLTETTPILFAGVADYRNALHMLPSRDRFTGRNVTGIAGLTAYSDGISLLIEAADQHPDAVGIFYDPADSATIYQNEIYERMLTDAGIPWKEYEIISEEVTESSETIEHKSSLPAIPLPTITAAASGKEGPNIHPDSIGDSGDLTGINEPSSARSAKRSELWKKRRDQNTGTFKEILPIATNECDVLYLSAGNIVFKNKINAALLNETCLKKDIVTVGGDISTSECSTVCLCTDPYELGFKCGETSATVLEGNKNISEIEVTSISSIETAKVYNHILSSALGRTWPKSFNEITSYLNEVKKKKYTFNETP